MPKKEESKKNVDNKKSEPVAKEKKTGKGFLTALKIVLFTSSFLLLTISSGVFAYQSQFQNKAFYGTKILGEDVGGKSVNEVRKLLSVKIEKIKLTFNVDGQDFEAKPEEAGVVFSLGQTAEKAIEEGKDGSWYQNSLKAASSLLYKASPNLTEAFTVSENIEVNYRIDDEKLTNFTESISNSFDQAPKNAGLVVRGTEVQVIPAVAGRRIVNDSIKKQLAAAIKDSKQEKIQIDVEKIDPAIIDEDTKNSIAHAKNIISQPVKFTYKEKSFLAKPEEVASWIVFEEKEQNGRTVLVPEVDPKQVYSYIYGIGSQINVAAVNKKVTVVNGAEQKVESDGKDGLAVDVDLAAVDAARTLTQVKPVSMELPTYTVKYKTKVNNVVVANWAKYITVNIGQQKMCAWLAGGELVNCWAVTTGKNGLSTPVGTHLISRKAGAGGAAGAAGGGVCMPNPPSSTPLCGINFVSTFTSAGHAFHEAWWRSSFGGPEYTWNGSHGCVNTPYDVAKFIYYWAPIGTPVIISK